jgi:O-antigen ligase
VRASSTTQAHTVFNLAQRSSTTLSPAFIALAAAALALPWLNPFNYGPSTGAVSWGLAGAASALEPWVSAVQAAASGDAAAESAVVYGNLRQPNQFASLMNMGLLALLLLWCFYKQNRLLAGIESARAATNLIANQAVNHQRWVTACVAGAAALLMFANAASGSRTGLVQLLMLGGMLWVWRKKSSRVAVRTTNVPQAAAHPTDAPREDAPPRLLSAYLGALGVYGASLLALWPLGYGLLARFGGAEEAISSCSSRAVLWRNVLELIAQRPWGGWGVGELDFSHFTHLYQWPASSAGRFCDILDNAHNLPLHIAVELGLPAALLACGAFAWWVWRRKPWAEQAPLRQLCWGALALLVFHSLVEYPLWYGPFFLSALLCVGLLWPRDVTHRAAHGATHGASHDDAAHTANHDANRPLAQVKYARAAINLIALVAVLSLLIITAYVAWDYHRISQLYIAPEQRHSAYQNDTLQKAKASWLFQSQVRFADLMTSAPVRGGGLDAVEAAQQLVLAEQCLHYSPEPRVIERLIESAVAIGYDDVAMAFLMRYKIAFPSDYAKWSALNAKAAQVLRAPGAALPGEPPPASSSAR